MNKAIEKKADSLIHNNRINLIWLILMIMSASVGIISSVVMVLAVGDIQILSWSIGYILTSGTNETVQLPSIVITIICLAVFIICIAKNAIIRAIVKD